MVSAEKRLFDEECSFLEQAKESVNGAARAGLYFCLF